MHLLAAMALLLTATPGSPEALAAPRAEGVRELPTAEEPPIEAQRDEDGAVRTPPARPGVGTTLLGAGAVALGGAAGVLLSLPLTVPILYLAALASLPAAAGALPLLLVVPLAAALGSGGAARAFSEGIGPWLVGTLSGAAAGVTLLVVGAVVVPAQPRTLLDLHLGVLSVVGVPSLAAAATAAAVLPFFVTGSDAAFE